MWNIFCFLPYTLLSFSLAIEIVREWMIFVSSRMIKSKHKYFSNHSSTASTDKEWWMGDGGFGKRLTRGSNFSSTRHQVLFFRDLCAFFIASMGGSKSKCYLITFGISGPGRWFRMQEAIDRCYEYRSSEIRKAKIIGSTGARSRAIPRKVIQ